MVAYVLIIIFNVLAMGFSVATLRVCWKMRRDRRRR